MWNGPAPEHRYNSTFHRGWHHLWRYSQGDIANDEPAIRSTWPDGSGCRLIRRRYSAPAADLALEGAFETPDSQIAVYVTSPKMVITLEPTLTHPTCSRPTAKSATTDMFPYWPQNATRIELYGTKGLMCVGRHGGGWQVYIRPKDRKPVVTAPSTAVSQIRTTRKTSSSACEIARRRTRMWKKGTSAWHWCTTPISVCVWVARSWSSIPKTEP